MTKSTLRININKRVILVLPDSLGATVNLTIPALFFRREFARQTKAGAVAATHRARAPSGIAKDAGARGQAGAPFQPELRRYRVDKRDRKSTRLNSSH